MRKRTLILSPAADIENWLSVGVLPGGTPEFRDWIGRTREFGPLELLAIVRALRGADASRTYAALLALRSMGFEAWQEEEGTQARFHLRMPADTDEFIIQKGAGRGSSREPSLPDLRARQAILKGLLKKIPVRGHKDALHLALWLERGDRRDDRAELQGDRRRQRRPKATTG